MVCGLVPNVLAVMTTVCLQAWGYSKLWLHLPGFLQTASSNGPAAKLLQGPVGGTGALPELHEEKDKPCCS